MGEELSLRTPHSHHPRKATHARQNGPPIPGDGGTQEKRDPAAERCLREFIIRTQFRCHGTFFLEKIFQVFWEAQSCQAGPTRRIGAKNPRSCGPGWGGGSPTLHGHGTAVRPRRSRISWIVF